MNAIKIKYDPNKSVKDNALMCGVSESAVRKYIHTHCIDRRTDGKIARQRVIQSFRRDNPNASISYMSRVLGYSPNTVRKYLRACLNFSIKHRKCVSSFWENNYF